jgi:hypothetical protein
MSARSLRLWTFLALLGLMAFSGLRGASSPAQALPAGAVRYVAAAGADTGTCTVVTEPCATPQYAADQAADGDEIRVAIGTYGAVSHGGSTQVLAVEKALTVRGGYSSDFTTRDPAAYPTILDAAGAGRVVLANTAVAVLLDGLQIVNGLAPGWTGYGGGIYASTANLTLNGCTVKDNHINLGNGSGIWVKDGSLTMTDCLVQSNEPNNADDNYGLGGGVYTENADVSIRASQVVSNTAHKGSWLADGRGGGIYLAGSRSVVQDVTLRGNTACTGGWGEGGGLAASGGTLQLLDSLIEKNIAAWKDCESATGGGVWLKTDRALVSGNTISDNNTNGPIDWSYGCLRSSAAGGIAINNSVGITLTGNVISRNWSITAGGVYAYDQLSLTMEDNQVIDNTGRSYAGGISLGATPRGVESAVTLRNNLIQGNATNGAGGGISGSGPFNLIGNRFVNNHSGGNGGAVYVAETSRTDTATATFDGNLFDGNNSGGDGGALDIDTVFSPNFNIAYRNLAFIRNTAAGNGGAVNFHRYANTITPWQQVTFTNNRDKNGAMVYVVMGRMRLYNAIFYNAPIGVKINSGPVILDHSLAYSVTLPTQGTSVTLSNTVSGDPALSADGYHLTSGSAAVDAGVDLSVHTDIDGDARPLGNGPDLGADESVFFRNAAGVQASMYAGTPHWIVKYTGLTAPPTTVFEQDYLMPFGNYVPASGASLASYALQDTWPAALTLANAEGRPTMTYGRSGNVLTFGSLAALAPGGSGAVSLLGRSDSVTPGQSLVNSAQFNYTPSGGGPASISLQATTQVPERPLFSPLLLEPKDGEMCVDDSGQLSASGVASAGMAVRLYENEALVGQTTANGEGVWAINWNTTLKPLHVITLYAVSCEPGGACSAPSRSIRLTTPEGDWCPQRSWWEGTVNGTHFIFHFVDDRGRYATNDFVLPGVYGFNNTQIHLYSCCDLNSTNPFKVTADGTVYTNGTQNGRFWTFVIGSAHQVTVESQCVGREGTPPVVKKTGGVVLIDPDGFVFNGAQGASYSPTTGMLAPVAPVSGITVTAYYSATEWGTWIPWPAHLFDNQQNPQVTGANGYFAFFTPPGYYYLQAEAAKGYQAWRSPVVQVITQVVHVNIPLTQWAAGAARTVTLSPSSAPPPTLFLPVGGVAEWQSTLGASQGMGDLSRYLANPLLQSHSTRSPLTDTLGFDSGMLAPGQVYRRQFNQRGTFPYTDGAGHTAVVQVGLDKFSYLPLVFRQ